MIRIVTTTRLASLEADVEHALFSFEAAREAASEAAACHTRSVQRLSVVLDAARSSAEQARADADIVREILQGTEDELADARTTVAEQAARIEGLTRDLDAMAGAVVLLHYGKLHSVHPGEAAAKRHAASFGIDPDGWGTVPSDQPATESTWRISPLSKWAVADGGDVG